MSLKKSILPALFTVGILSLSACFSTDNSSSTPSNYVVGVNHIALSGQPNMRDLGGYIGANNKHILYNKLYRSGDFSKLSAGDIQTLAALNISNWVDLRTTAEIDSNVDKLPSGVQEQNLPLISSVGSGSSSQMMAEFMSGKVDPTSYMLAIYVVDSLKIANWKTFFAELKQGKSTLWHCTAGKDRAGMTAALVLSALGVSQDTVIADFMKSNTYLDSSNQVTVAALDKAYGAGVGEKLLPVLGVDSSYIIQFLNNINTNYGGMNKFLDSTLGVDRPTLQKLYLEN